MREIPWKRITAFEDKGDFALNNSHGDKCWRSGVWGLRAAYCRGGELEVSTGVRAVSHRPATTATDPSPTLKSEA